MIALSVAKLIFFSPESEISLGKKQQKKTFCGKFGSIDLLADKVAILISIVSNGNYGMPRGQIHINLPPEHPIMSFETTEIKMAAVSSCGKSGSIPTLKIFL